MQQINYLHNCVLSNKTIQFNSTSKLTEYNFKYLLQDDASLLADLRAIVLCKWFDG